MSHELSPEDRAAIKHDLKKAKEAEKWLAHEALIYSECLKSVRRMIRRAERALSK